MMIGPGFASLPAMVAAFAVSFYLQLGIGWDSDDPIGFAKIMLVTVGVTTIGWLATTFLTAPEPEQKESNVIHLMDALKRSLGKRSSAAHHSRQPAKRSPHRRKRKSAA